MAKSTHNVRHSALKGQQGLAASYEENVSVEESLLPDAVELAKLKDVDEKLVDWIKDRTALEQNARLDFNNRKMGLLEKYGVRTHKENLLTIVLAFIVIISGMAFSYLLILKEQTVVGTIFAGGTILLAANSFLNYRKNLQQKTK